MSDPEQSDADIWKPFLRGFAHRVREQLDNFGTKTDRRLAYTEELVDEGNEHNKEEANDPCTDRAHGEGRVIMWIDNGSHLSVRAVGRQE